MAEASKQGARACLVDFPAGEVTRSLREFFTARGLRVAQVGCRWCPCFRVGISMAGCHDHHA